MDVALALQGSDGGRDLGPRRNLTERGNRYLFRIQATSTNAGRCLRAEDDGDRRRQEVAFLVQ